MTILGVNPLFEERENEDMSTALDRVRTHLADSQSIEQERLKQGTDFSRPGFLADPSQPISSGFQTQTANSFTIAASTDRDDAGFFERVIAEPSRFAWQLARGVTAGTADLVELPERMANMVGRAFGMAPEDEFKLLNNLSHHMKDSVGGEQAPEWWADKVAYYMGYMIPDLIGIAAGAGVGKIGAQAVTRLSPKLMVHSGIVNRLGRAAGVIGYGTVKGGAFGGAEGAMHGFKQFTMMEVAASLFGGFSLPGRILANAGFMSAVTASQYDLSAPDWQDEVIASGILGGAFGAFTSRDKHKLLTNGNNQGKAKAWAAKRRLQGEKVGLNDYMQEFLSLETDALGLAYAGENPKGFKQKLRDRYKENTGQEPSSSDKIFTKQLTEFFVEGQEIGIKEATPFAEGLVKAADVFEKPRDYLNDPFVGDFIEAHGSKIWFERGQGITVFEGQGNKVRYIDPHGVEHSLSPKQAEAVKTYELKQTLVEKNTRKQAEKFLPEEKGWKGVLNTWHERLVNPEGAKFWKLEAGSKEGFQTAKAIHNLTYSARSWADQHIEKLWKRSGIDKISVEERKDLNSLLMSGKWEDVHLRDQAKGKNRILPQSLTEAQTVQKVTWDSVKKRGGQNAVSKLEKILGTLEGERTRITLMSHEAGLIKESTKNIFLHDKRLGRQARYTRTVALREMERKLKMQDQKFYQESLSSSALDKFLTKHQGELMIDDAVLMWEQEIRAKHYMMARNNAIREWVKTAENQSTEISYAKIPRYEHYQDGKLLNEKQLVKAQEQIETINQAHKNKQGRVSRKEEMRQHLSELELEEAMLNESTGQAVSGSFLEAERAALEGSSIKKRPAKEDFGKIEKEIEGLYKEINNLVDKTIQIEDWAAGDFSRFDVKRPNIKVPTERTATKEFLKLEKVRGELQEKVGHLKEELKKPKIERRLIQEEGFVPVQYLEKGFEKTLLIEEGAAGLLNLGSAIGKDQSAVLRTLGLISGATPVRLLATATNSVFALRSVHRDIMHFWTADTLNKSGPVSYMKDFLGTSPELLVDVAKQGDRFQKYVDAGGSRFTRSLVSAEDTMLFHAEELYRGARPQSRKIWENAINIVSKPNDIMEVAVRTFAFEQMQKRNPAMSASDAAYNVNKMLNFSRKGNAMRYMDSVIPFLNVGTQALAAQARAAIKDPKLYMGKMATYWGLRMSLATAAYMIAPEVMDDVNPRSKVGNVIIPLGLSPAEDANGDKRYPYVQIPVEKNPITGALDSALFGALDIMRDKDNLADWNDILGMYYDNYDFSTFALAGLGPDALPPAMSALMAAKQNRDPMTGDNIWRGNPAINAAARFGPDTNRLAIAAGQITGSSPVGIERAVQSMTANNMYTGFLGWLLHDVTPEEKQSMSMAVTEGMPGLSNMVKWTRPSTNLLRLIQGDNATQKYQDITLRTKIELGRVIEGKISMPAAIQSLKGNQDWTTLDRKEAVDMLKRNLKGWRRYQAVVDKSSPELTSNLPSVKEFQVAAMSDVKTRAKWWVSRIPDSNLPERKLFNQIGMAYFGNSNKFNYWRRKYLRDPETD